MNDDGKSDDSSALVKVQINDVSALGPRADIEPGDLDFRF